MWVTWVRSNRITYLARARSSRSSRVGSLRARDGVSGQGVLGVATIASPVGTRLGVHGALGVGLVRVLEVLLRRVRRVLLAVVGRVGWARGRDGGI
jgi:hypothetical protein